MINAISFFLVHILHKEIEAAEAYQQRAILLGFSLQRAGEILNEEMKFTETTARSTLQAIEIASRRLTVEEIS